MIESSTKYIDLRQLSMQSGRDDAGGRMDPPIVNTTRRDNLALRVSRGLD